MSKNWDDNSVQKTEQNGNRQAEKSALGTPLDAALDKGAASPVSEQDNPAFGKSASQRSLIDDVEALIHDGRTYFDAELSYQKTRAGFVSDRLKKTLIFGCVAAVLAVLAVLGLVVGSIVALAPLITGWGATGVVVGVLLLAVVICGMKAASSAKSMIAVIKTDKPEKPDNHENASEEEDA